MKVGYNWLKEFVDIPASPEEVASRLALSGTNIASIEKGPHGAVIDAEITSNRPDCLAHYGVARELSAVYKLPLKPFAPKVAESSAAKAADPHCTGASGVSAKKCAVGPIHMIARYDGTATATHANNRRSPSPIRSTFPSPIKTRAETKTVR